MKNKYDIAVIGAGIGGLVSAALLSKLGKKVLIIEKEPKAGGYLTQFKADEFIFDVSLHLLNSCSQGQYIYESFRKYDIINNVNFLKPKYLYRSIFPDYDIRVPQADLIGYKRILFDLFPASQQGVEILFSEMANVFHMVNDHIYNNDASPLTLLPYLRTSAEDMINRHISDERLKAIICQLWIYFGLPPSLLRPIDFYYPWFDYLNNGGYYIEKGSYEIVKLLVKRIQENGGEFLFNRDVGRILVKNNLCQKVMFGKDEVLSDTIISDIDLTKTVYELIGIDQFSQDNIEKFRCIKPSISAFEVFLGLNTDLKKQYPNDYEIFVNSDYDINSHYHASLANNANKAPFVVTINSNVNRFSAPQGKSVITIIMLSGYNYWDSNSRQEYQDKKDKMAETLIRRTCSVIPEIKSHIQTKVISTPVTFERYTNNSKGAIYGYSWTKGKRKETRPNEIKGLKNLYFASAWARQGSGVVKVLRAADDVCAKISQQAERGVYARQS